MKLHIDKETKRIIGYTLLGNPVDDKCEFVEVDMKEEDVTDDLFYSTFEDGKIILDEAFKNETLHTNLIKYLRDRREAECFPIINRGSIWYTLNVNSATKLKELTQWYKDWLDVTKTLEIPTKPSWIEDGGD